MKKIVLSICILVASLVFSGCSWQDVENTWVVGKKVGGVVLPESTKIKLTPIVKSAEYIYKQAKENKKKDVN